jgi:hypothetical protein
MAMTMREEMQMQRLTAAVRAATDAVDRARRDLAAALDLANSERERARIMTGAYNAEVDRRKALAAQLRSAQRELTEALTRAAIAETNAGVAERELAAVRHSPRSIPDAIDRATGTPGTRVAVPGPGATSPPPSDPAPTAPLEHEDATAIRFSLLDLDLTTDD